MALAPFYAEGQLLGLLIPKPELFLCCLSSRGARAQSSDAQASAPEILILTGLTLGLSAGLFKHPPNDSNVQPSLRTTGLEPRLANSDRGGSSSIAQLWLHWFRINV